MDKKKKRQFLYENLKFGDMVLTNTVNWEGVPLLKKIVYKIVYFLIRVVSGTKYVHVTMALGKNQFLSFEPPFAKEIDLDDFINHKILIRRREYPWTKEQRQKVKKLWYDKYKGVFYDLHQLWNILKHWWKNIPEDQFTGDLFPGNEVCSTGFCALERATGENTFGKTHTGRVTPGHCRRNKLYKDLWEY